MSKFDLETYKNDIFNNPQIFSESPKYDPKNKEITNNKKSKFFEGFVE